jgi:hypothetical protein
MDGAFVSGSLVTIFSCFETLERVSLKNVRCEGSSTAFVPIPQPWLIRFVREVPNLRWFRSDLTPENVALLKRERPEVVFAP